jgi:hypothetical protein
LVCFLKIFQATLVFAELVGLLAYLVYEILVLSLIRLDYFILLVEDLLLLGVVPDLGKGFV